MLWVSLGHGLMPWGSGAQTHSPMLCESRSYLSEKSANGNVFTWMLLRTAKTQLWLRCARQMPTCELKVYTKQFPEEATQSEMLLASVAIPLSTHLV